MASAEYAGAENTKADNKTAVTPANFWVAAFMIILLRIKIKPVIKSAIFQNIDLQALVFNKAALLTKNLFD